MGMKKLLLKPITDQFFLLYEKIYGQENSEKMRHVLPFEENETICLAFKNNLEMLSEKRIKKTSLIMFISYQTDQAQHIYFSNFLLDPELQKKNQQLTLPLLTKLARRENATQMLIRSKNRCTQERNDSAGLLIIDLNKQEQEEERIWNTQNNRQKSLKQTIKQKSTCRKEPQDSNAPAVTILKYPGGASSVINAKQSGPKHSKNILKPADGGIKFQLKKLLCTAKMKLKKQK